MEEKQELLSARLSCPYGIDNFYFRKKILTGHEFLLLQETRYLKYDTGGVIYAARPYTTEIGQSKLYKDDRGKFFRCSVGDIFTKNIDGQLAFHLSIRLIDTGRYLFGVSIDQLYDYPKAIQHFRDIEPEAKRACIWLGQTFPKILRDRQINDYFKSNVAKHPKKDFKIHILDYDPDADVYYIDIIDNSGNSLAGHLREKFSDKLRNIKLRTNSVGTSQNTDNISHQVGEKTVNYSRSLTSRSDRTIKVGSNLGPSHRRYYGIMHYYKQKLRDPDRETYFRSRFFRVRLISWSRPDSFYIIPDDNNYFNTHDTFQKDLLKLHEYDFEEESPTDKEPYHIGEKCWFMNRDNPNIGKWLRGIIDKAPRCREKSEPRHSSNYNLWTQEELDEFVADSQDFCYLVRSIDFGFTVTRTVQNLRRVKNIDLFHQRGPWALRCRLFGIDVLQHELGSKTLSQNCLDSFDKWCRQNMKDSFGRFSPFYVLFKDDLLRLPDALMSDDNSINVTFFHRIEAPYTIQDAVIRRKDRVKFESLNVHLMDKGLVGNYIHKRKKSSNVELDQYVINQLVIHEKIESH